MYRRVTQLHSLCRQLARVVVPLGILGVVLMSCGLDVQASSANSACQAAGCGTHVQVAQPINFKSPDRPDKEPLPPAVWPVVVLALGAYYARRQYETKLSLDKQFLTLSVLRF